MEKRVTDGVVIVLLMVMVGVMVQANWTMQSAANKAHEIVEEDQMFEAEWKYKTEGNPNPITIRVSDTDFEEFRAKLDQALKAYPPNC